MTARPLAGTEGARYPFWAPDGRAIGFFADGKLKRIDLESGGLQVLADAPSGRGGTWNRDDVIVFAPDVIGDLMRVTHGRKTGARDAASVRPRGSHRWPQFLPDGRHFLFFVPGTGVRKRGVCTSERSTAASRRAYSPQRRRPCLCRPARCCGCSRTYSSRSASTQSIRWSVTSRSPWPRRSDSTLASLRGAFAVSATGVLAHRAGVGERRQLTWVDREGIARGTVGPPDQAGLSSPELAPDGQQVAVQRTVRGNQDVWLINTGRDLPSTLNVSRKRRRAASMVSGWEPLSVQVLAKRHL